MKGTIIKPPQRRRPKAVAAGASRQTEQYYSKTIARALDVLECFSDDLPTLSLKEISGVTRLPEASLFRILLTLESRGYLARNPDGSYRLSRKLLFGKLLERAERLAALVHPELQKLASRFNETASLSYLFEDRIQVLDTVETFHEIRMNNKPGRVLPPHCSAMGKAITAFQERPVADRILEVYGLTRRTENTIISRDALLAEFEQIRANGYAMDREESITGGVCVGSPIHFENGRVVAAVSVSTPKARMTREKEEEIIQAVMDSTRSISNAIRSLQVPAGARFGRKTSQLA